MDNDGFDKIEPVLISFSTARTHTKKRNDLGCTSLPGPQHFIPETRHRQEADPLAVECALLLHLFGARLPLYFVVRCCAAERGFVECRSPRGERPPSKAKLHLRAPSRGRNGAGFRTGHFSLSVSPSCVGKFRYRRRVEEEEKIQESHLQPLEMTKTEHHYKKRTAGIKTSSSLVGQKYAVIGLSSREPSPVAKKFGF